MVLISCGCRSFGPQTNSFFIVYPRPDGRGYFLPALRASILPALVLCQHNKWIHAPLYFAPLGLIVAWNSVTQGCALGCLSVAASRLQRRLTFHFGLRPSSLFR